MTIAFVETTVLTDILLKKDGSELKGLAALKGFSDVQIPQYAWKEFKRGPLNNVIWFHNKLVDTNSFAASLLAVQRISLSPKRYLTSTSIQAMHTAFINLFSKQTAGSISATYGPNVTYDALMTKAFRVTLKDAISRAWNARTSLHGGAIQTLDCYPDVPLKLDKAQIDPRPRDCTSKSDCCIRLRTLTRKADLLKMLGSLSVQSSKKETIERRKVLRSLAKHPNSSMGVKECTRFGDAYFVLFCPTNGTIITTNTSDILPMANALSVAVQKP